jgi:hypothetical protein
VNAEDAEDAEDIDVCFLCMLCVSAEWKVSANNQRTRVYRLTAAGRKHLASERARWTEMSDAIAGILKPREA